MICSKIYWVVPSLILWVGMLLLFLALVWLIRGIFSILNSSNFKIEISVLIVLDMEPGINAKITSLLMVISLCI